MALVGLGGSLVDGEEMWFCQWLGVENGLYLVIFVVLRIELRWWDYGVLGLHYLKNINYYGYKI